MRHGNKIKKLGRTHAHRKATMAALSTALIEHKRITTTLPKAKALRTFVEPIINRAKEDTTTNRRQVFRRLQSKEAVKTLFGEIADVLGDRPGGYTRVVKLGQRAGDAAELAIIELVDFNDVKPEGGGTKKKTRRSRRRSSDAPQAKATAPKAAPAPQPQAEAIEAPAEEAPAPEPEAAPEAAAPEAVPEVEPEAEAVVSDAADPDTTANPQVPVSEEAEHGDLEQGAAPGTGEPPPEADADTRGHSEHRG